MYKPNLTISKTNNNLKAALLGLLIAVCINFPLCLGADSADNENNILEFELKRDELAPHSPFLDPSARVGEEAAAIEKTSEGQENYHRLLNEKTSCFSLPQNFWVVILAAYVLLLIFNLTWDLNKAQKIRWFWELFYSFLFLLIWFQFDECRQNNWFAQSLILIGLIIYFFYFYYHSRLISQISLANKEENEAQEDKTEPLPLE